MKLAFGITVIPWSYAYDQGHVVSGQNGLQMRSQSPP